MRKGLGMQYKTVMLELIQERKELHQRLMQERGVLSTVERLAVLLRDCHLQWISELQAMESPVDPQLIKHEAFRLAVEELLPVLQGMEEGLRWEAASAAHQLRAPEE